MSALILKQVFGCNRIFWSQTPDSECFPISTPLHAQNCSSNFTPELCELFPRHWCLSHLHWWQSVKKIIWFAQATRQSKVCFLCCVCFFICCIFWCYLWQCVKKKKTFCSDCKEYCSSKVMKYLLRLLQGGFLKQSYEIFTQIARSIAQANLWNIYSVCTEDFSSKVTKYLLRLHGGFLKQSCEIFAQIARRIAQLPLMSVRQAAGWNVPSP